MDQKTERLLDWYDRNARSMPWRGERDPYRIWVSEIMLQQTRVETVTGYYDRFLRTFPTLRSLAEAAEEDVLKQWEGLGYYSRARNLRSGAEQVLREYGGRIPSDPAELRRIRGIGAYTAAAVASIAFGVRAAAVDGNVVRVISRLYGVEEDVTEREVRRRVERLADGLTPPERPGDHNQAMMDLGATVCVPGTPDCGACPLRGLCEAERNGNAPELPRASRAKPPREILFDLFLLYSGNRVLMRRRTEKLLEGMWCFPMAEGRKTPEERAGEIRKKWGWQPERTRFRGEAKHIFTHQIWRMALYEAEVPPGTEAPAGYEWIPLNGLGAVPLPAAVKAAAELARKRAEAGETIRSGEISRNYEKTRDFR